MNDELKKRLRDKKRIVVCHDAIDERSMNTLLEDIMHLALDSDKEIKLMIDSKGGEVYFTLPIYDFLISLSELNITAIVNGWCASAAVLILLGCKQRLATQHSIFLCHNARLKGTVLDNILLDKNVESKIESRIKSYISLRTSLQTIIRSRTKLSKSKVE